MAVNREYADRDAVLHAGDELALIPPVSGGAVAAREPKTEWGRRFWAAVDGEAPGPPCAQLLGWKVLEMEPGRSRIEFEARPEFVNPGGVVQGGFLAAMLDDTMGPSAVAANGGDAFTPTLEMKASFLRPALPGRLIAEGRVVHMGRSIVFLEGTLAREDGEIVATATATSRLLKFDEQTRAARARAGRAAVRRTASCVRPTPASTSWSAARWAAARHRWRSSAACRCWPSPAWRG